MNNDHDRDRDRFNTHTAEGEENELFWAEFLRDNTRDGGTAQTNPAERPSLARAESDRKRSSGAAQPGRKNPHLISSNSTQTVVAGSSRNTAIDLTSPPTNGVPSVDFGRIQRPLVPVESTLTRALAPTRRTSEMSEVVPPPWQPDAEVTKCPVCNQEFSWRFRKHHCRKCGRVVCGECSPHMITIPREYIVRAPGEPGQLYGAQQVRVCKPCVPDPWTPSPSLQLDMTPTTEPGFPMRLPPPQPLTQPFRLPSIGTRRAIEARAASIATRNLAFPPRRSSVTGRGAPPAYDSITLRQTVQQAIQPQAYDHRPGFPATLPPNHPSRSIWPTTTLPESPPGMIPMPSPVVPTSSRPRRNVKEEDECPVCGQEMVPGEEFREQHIQACIEARTSPSSHNANTGHMRQSSATTIPSGPGSGARNFYNLPPSSLPGPSPGSMSTRVRANSTYRSRGMINYSATEKDCLDGDGKEQECTICMEEFVPGAEMGRLECWCKFHRACIREWWSIKGAGSCPVHVVQE